MLCAIAFGNILLGEIVIGRKLTKLHIGMTQSEVIKAVGKPYDNTIARYYNNSSGQEIHIADKRNYIYYFFYFWDYVLLFPQTRARGFKN